MTETFFSESNLIPGEANTYNGYTFTKIADTNGSFDSLLASSINDSGTVAFSGRLDDGSEGVFTSSGRELTTIIDTSSSSFDTFGDPVINNNGTVVIEAAQLADDNSVSNDAILTGSGGELTTIASSGDRFFGFQSQPDLNDRGTVAFFANPPGEFESLFTASADGEISTLVTAIDNMVSLLVQTP